MLDTKYSSDGVRCYGENFSSIGPVHPVAAHPVPTVAAPVHYPAPPTTQYPTSEPVREYFSPAPSSPGYSPVPSHHPDIPSSSILRRHMASRLHLRQPQHSHLHRLLMLTHQCPLHHHRPLGLPNRYPLHRDLRESESLTPCSMGTYGTSAPWCRTPTP